MDVRGAQTSGSILSCHVMLFSGGKLQFDPVKGFVSETVERHLALYSLFISV
jgi:hypothetical protein